MTKEISLFIPSGLSDFNSKEEMKGFGDAEIGMRVNVKMNKNYKPYRVIGTGGYNQKGKVWNIHLISEHDWQKNYEQKNS